MRVLVQLGGRVTVSSKVRKQRGPFVEYLILYTGVHSGLYGGFFLGGAFSM